MLYSYMSPHVNVYKGTDTKPATLSASPREFNFKCISAWLEELKMFFRTTSMETFAI